MKKLFSFLRSRDLISAGGPSVRRVSALSITKFVDTIKEIENIITESHKPADNPIFSHSASLGLGGSASYCRSVFCRLKRINNLARFALMYSDRVFISSFFSEYKHLSKRDVLTDSLQRFYEDLIVLFEIKGAIVNGFIEFFAPETETCFACQAKSFLGTKSALRFSESYDSLQEEYLKNMQVTCEKRDGEYAFTCQGSTPYFDHNVIVVTNDLHPEILKQHRTTQRIESGKQVSISKTLTKKIDLHVRYAHEAARNAIYGLATSKCLNTTFLTESDLHIKLLNSLHHEKSAPEKNDIAYKHMTSIVPFLEEISLTNLIRLRQRENEAFLVYRQALKQAINSFTECHGSFTEQDAKSIYSDVVAPSLAALDQKVKRAKRGLISKPVRSLTGVVGSISFGLLTGIVPPDISSIASAIGLVKFGSDFIKDVMALGDKEDKIEDHQFYFLWKVKQKAD